jgi:hypothetical protein
MAREAVCAFEDHLGLAQQPVIRYVQRGMASATTCFAELFRQHRLRPEMNIAVSVGLIRRLALASVANGAAVFGWVVNDRFVSDQNLVTADRLLARPHAHVARDATVAGAQDRVDDLSQLHLNRSLF